MMRAARLLLLGGLLSTAACAPPPPAPPEPRPLPEPAPAEVEHVIYLVGDPGEARRGDSPVLIHLQRDIERWAGALQADSAVMVLFLGDLIYPDGMHPRGSEMFPHDSATVMDQVQLLAGPQALRRGARGYFLAGNHDWGLEEDWEGYVRLVRLDEFLDLARASTGASVRLAPDAGQGGPFVLDLGTHLRLLLLDTAWWLLDGGRRFEDGRARMLDRIEQTMRTAEGREVVIAAHHPFRSAGPHGGEFDFWKTFGLRYLLARSGAILQDVTSVPYRELEAGLRDIFLRTRPPLLFVGGHEHSLQLIEAMEPSDPRFSAVSGSASKLTPVGQLHGLRFGRSEPGYMRLFVLRGGGVLLSVEAAPERFLECPAEATARARCMSEGVGAFRTVHSHRLR